MKETKNTDISFTKMHGLGNDFMVIDATRKPFFPDAETIAKWSDRHCGIGFDQLLVIEPSQLEDADFHYRIFNADGHEVEHCGNGARCFGKYVRDKGLTQKHDIVVSTAKGMIIVSYIGSDWYEVTMGKGSIKPEDLPFSPDNTTIAGGYTYEINLESDDVTLPPIQFTPVSVGNPHAVILVDDIKNAPVDVVGQLFQQHAAFPNQVNVGFMKIQTENRVSLRVFERGVGETQACGTGACAAVFAGIKQGLLASPVNVKLTGGSLMISVTNDVITMSGEAKTVFEGTISA